MLSLSTAPPREPAPPFPAQEWGWARPAPASQKAGGGGGGGTKTARKKLSEQEKALREFTCGLCKGVLGEPVSTPCGEPTLRTARRARCNLLAELCGPSSDPHRSGVTEQTVQVISIVLVLAAWDLAVCCGRVRMNNPCSGLYSWALTASGGQCSARLGQAV